MKRYLIVNADDFGLSPGVNRGVIQAYERGIVTSASLMVRWAAAASAAAYATSHPTLDIGLHFDLGEWVFREGGWFPIYAVVPPDDPVAVTKELKHQLDLFRKLIGKNPTHLDSHQHVHRAEPARSILCEAATELDIPLRDCNPDVRYDGRFYGQTGKGEPLPDSISTDALIEILQTLSAAVTELGCHPGFDEELDSMYRDHRGAEVKTLCDPRVRAVVDAERIELISFQKAIVGAQQAGNTLHKTFLNTKPQQL